MGLFNNNPYSNLHELNLDWVISKLKDVDKAQTAAEEVVGLVDDAHDYCERAETAAVNASSSAAHAYQSELNAATSEDNADNFSDLAKAAKIAAESAKDDAIQAKDDAVQAKLDAEAARDLALQYEGDAYLHADAAHQDANSAHLDAQAAAADADRAQLYGASTGVMCFNTEISAQTGANIPAGYGTYVIIYFASNTASSSGINIVRHKYGNFRNRNLVLNGGAPAPLTITQSGTDIHVYAGIADGDMYIITLGYADA